MDIIDALLAETSAAVRREGRPWVSLCYAQSLDGSLTARPGESTALSGPDSSKLTHRLRAAHDAILVGVGTVLANDPRLTVRLVEGRNPQPVILDSRLRTPPQAHLVQAHPLRAWIATTQEGMVGSSDALASLAGVRMLALPVDPQGRVSMLALLDHLGELGIRRLMVEGGARVLTSFLS
jgi:riboflavin-specific deaminase-like protein